MLESLLPPPSDISPPEGVGPVHARRVAAREGLTSLPVPSTEEEAWRYGRIGDLDVTNFAPLTGPRPALTHGAVTVAALDSVPTSARATIVDGSLVDTVISAAALAQGVVVVDALTDPLGAVLSSTLVHSLFNATIHDSMATVALAGAPSVVVVVIPPNAVVVDPIVVVHQVASPTTVVPSHIVVVAGANSEATIVEWHGSSGGSELSLPLVEVVVEQGARLRLMQVQDRPREAWQLGNLRSVVDRDATFELFHAGLGGCYVRQRTDCRLVGPGATGNLNALYFGDGDQTLDFRTFQIHEAPNTTSNLLFSGAVGGRSHSVYTGLIRIEKEARGSTAFQTNRNLKLSQDAWADSVPNLEIENNDVRCSHASTVSPVDIDQLFYIESRGVPTAVAERLVVEGFFTDVLDQFPVLELRPWLRDQIAARLQETAGP